MNEFYIVMGGAGLYGHYGKGKTLDEARAAYRKAGGKGRGRVTIVEHRFVSDLPFAPMDRAATEQEADAWVGRDGSINWVRCKRDPEPVAV